ncbi:hypothetical protein XELAEV_18022404mg [Xenopus laevis]|uniref:Uncharacterized protein n=1 Tax=Xenopus laevis TaxID=8355 RepID=A0A974D506_XENLA|nr:hypothetical protein XELAEV_18022404mg [Xenopus laevis]
MRYCWANLNFYCNRRLMQQLLKSQLSLLNRSHPYQIFVDLSPMTLQRRRNMGPITKILSQHKIPYCWLFPFRLLLTYHNKQHTILTPEEGLTVLFKLGLSETASTEPSFSLRSQTKLTPIWERVLSRSQRMKARQEAPT